MPHGAEWHDGGSAGFTQFPERFRTSIRHSLGFGIVAEFVEEEMSAIRPLGTFVPVFGDALSAVQFGALGQALDDHVIFTVGISF